MFVAKKVLLCVNFKLFELCFFSLQNQLISKVDCFLKKKISGI